MITLFGIKLSIDTLTSVFFFILFAWSEYLGGNKKLESNNITEQLYRLLRLNRKEDDKIKRILDIIRDGK